MSEQTFKREHINAKKSMNWRQVIWQSEPMDSPAADEAHDKKVLDGVDFYYQMAAAMTDLLMYEAEECQRIGRQYASVDRVYDACLSDLAALRDYITDFIDGMQDGQKMCHGLLVWGGMTNAN